MPSEILGVAPWVIFTGIVAWFGSIYANRDKQRQKDEDQADRLVVHRDELTLQIIRTGREEISAARLEADDLRNEVRKLRAMETHFYHFQQSLDHLEALLTATTPQEQETAERNARAFVNRMRRLADAKGTVANEVQRKVSENSLTDWEKKVTDPHMQAQLDTAARQRGFKDYAQYDAWDRNTRQVVMHGDGTSQQQQPQQPAPTNWLQNLMEHIPLHPAMLFKHISDKMSGAGL